MTSRSVESAISTVLLQVKMNGWGGESVAGMNEGNEQDAVLRVGITNDTIERRGGGDM